MSFDVVIPTTGRASLARLLGALAPQARLLAAHAERRGRHGLERVIVVDDRPGRASPLSVPVGVEVLFADARGPAAARNVGWRAASAEWVAFLDDDAIPPPRWSVALACDLAALPPSVAGSQGQIRVPLPPGRRPTDWERNVAGLEHARWATADMSFRRRALQAVGGFDERFPRAYREDADLALRLLDAGFELEGGRRHVVHPVGPASRWVSLRLQAGNADDAMMDRLHGAGWRERAGAPRGRRRRHLVATAAGLSAFAVPGAAARRALALVWAALAGELAWARIVPGPRTRHEVTKMLATSAVMPALASWQWARGHLRARRLDGDRAGAPVPDPAAVPPLAILLDRDGTLVHDVPYNSDPERIRPLPGVPDALERARRADVKLAVVSNQSGVGRGLIDPGDLLVVNRRVEELLGPLGPWLICPHAPEAACGCRKPAPGLIVRAAARLAVPVWRCAVIGDIGADVAAARAAGARAVLVPTAQTQADEIAAAPEVAATLGEAIDRLLAVEPSPEAVAV